jgi:hypothetical protein
MSRIQATVYDLNNAKKFVLVRKHLTLRNFSLHFIKVLNNVAESYSDTVLIPPLASTSHTDDHDG